MVCVCVCVCVCVRACVSVNKKVTSFVPRKQTKEQKASSSSSSSREVDLDCLVAVFVLEQELQKERERERSGLIFWFFHFLQRAGRRKKRSCSTFPSHKKSEQPWLTYSTREVIRNKSALTSGK